MQRAELAVLVAAGLLLLQRCSSWNSVLTSSSGVTCSLASISGQVLLERIPARPPVARLLQVRRQLADGDVRSCLAWH